MKQYTEYMRTYMREATRLLGEPAVPLRLEYAVRAGLTGRLQLIKRKGLEDEPALTTIDDSEAGHELYVGLAHYRWNIDDGDPIELVQVAVAPGCQVGDFWAVSKRRVRAFYKRVRKHCRERLRPVKPIMAESTSKRLWDNTVGLLCRSNAALERFGVAMKRGVLLMGEPGNGKTMACRWLAHECRRSGLEWKDITSDQFAGYARQGRARDLFHLDKPGIVLFDDFDTALRDREQFGESDYTSMFLTELDGLRPKSGVVYLFTSNKRLTDLDPAIRRPGRIDVMINFTRPDAELRRQYVMTSWQSEILEAVEVQSVVSQTAGFSFAEIEEARRTLVMHYFDTNRWDWSHAVARMRERTSLGESPRIGFSVGSTSCPEDYQPSTSAVGGN